MPEPTDLLRIINVLLSMLAAAGLIAAYIRNHDKGLHRPEDVPVIALMLFAAYGSGEAARQDAPMGVRVVLWLVGSAGLVVALLVSLRGKRTR